MLFEVVYFSCVMNNNLISVHLVTFGLQKLARAGSIFLLRTIGVALTQIAFDQTEMRRLNHGHSPASGSCLLLDEHNSNIGQFNLAIMIISLHVNGLFATPPVRSKAVQVGTSLIGEMIKS